jgi:hypothetical protein
MNLFATYFPNLENISTTSNNYAFYITLMQAFQNSKFKYLKKFPLPSFYNKSDQAYVDWALGCQGKLTKLFLSDTVDHRGRDNIHDTQQFDRLVGNLALFTRLKEL